jgi:hypothetical protein
MATGADIALPAVSGFHARRPALASLDTGDAVLAFGLDAVVATEPPDVPLDDVVFAPWGAWPPAITGPHQLSAQAGASFAVAARPSGGTFALAFVAPGVGSTVARDVDPMSTVAASEGFPLFGETLSVATQANVSLAGFATEGEEVNRPYIDRINPEGGYSHAFSCSSTPIAEDVIPFGDGFLWAAAINGGPPDCPKVPVPAGSLLVVRIPAGGDTYAFQDAIDAGTLSDISEAPLRIRLAPRASGAWMLWQTSAGAAVQAQRLDANAAPDLPPFDVVPAAQPGFAVAPYGSGIAVAWIDAAGPPGTRLAIASFDDAGAQLGTAELPLGASSTVTGPLSLLTTKDALVVAWSEQDGDAPAQVHVARFAGCAGD